MSEKKWHEAAATFLTEVGLDPSEVVEFKVNTDGIITYEMVTERVNALGRRETRIEYWDAKTKERLAPWSKRVDA